MRAENHDVDIFNIIQKVQDTVIHLEVDEEQWKITQGSKRQAQWVWSPCAMSCPRLPDTPHAQKTTTVHAFRPETIVASKFTVINITPNFEANAPKCPEHFLLANECTHSHLPTYFYSYTVCIPSFIGSVCTLCAYAKIFSTL